MCYKAPGIIQVILLALIRFYFLLFAERFGLPIFVRHAGDCWRSTYKLWTKTLLKLLPAAKNFTSSWSLQNMYIKQLTFGRGSYRQQRRGTSLFLKEKTCPHCLQQIWQQEMWKVCNTRSANCTLLDCFCQSTNSYILLAVHIQACSWSDDCLWLETSWRLRSLVGVSKSSASECLFVCLREMCWPNGYISFRTWDLKVFQYTQCCMSACEGDVLFWQSSALMKIMCQAKRFAYEAIACTFF